MVEIYTFLTSKLDNIVNEKYGVEFMADCIYCGKSKHNKPHLGVNLEKGVFHCFRCNESGSIIKLLKDLNAPRKLIKLYTRELKRYNNNDLNVNSSLLNELNNRNYEEIKFPLFNYDYKFLTPLYSNDCPEKLKEYINKRLLLEDIRELYTHIYIPKGYIGYNYIFYPGIENEKLKGKKIASFGVYGLFGNKIYYRFPSFKIKAHNIISLNKEKDITLLLPKRNVFDIQNEINKQKANIVIGEGFFDVITFIILNNNLGNIYNLSFGLATHGKNRCIQEIIKTIDLYFINGLSELNIYFLIDKDVKKREALNFLNTLKKSILYTLDIENVNYFGVIPNMNETKDINDLLIKVKDYDNLIRELGIFSINV